MQSGIKNDPRNQEASKRSHKSLFHEFPDSPVLFFVDLLKVNTINVDNAAIDDAEST